MTKPTSEILLRSLPSVLAEDENMVALATGIAQELAARYTEIDEASIYARIDELPEELLDILAYDFKVDWWVPDATVAEKRQTLKDSWYVHKHLGTKAAVETALSAIYPEAKVIEWFNYDGGEPYHFKISIPLDSESIDPEKHAVVMSKINFYKNLRSELDAVEYSGDKGETMIYAGAVPVGQLTEMAVKKTD